jgi:aldose 1-epimerase
MWLLGGALSPPHLTRSPFGVTPAGEPVEIFTLTSTRGLEVRAMTWGARIVSILAPGRDGRPADIVLGYDSLTEYLGDSHYLGAVVGRFANRIANAQFRLDGNTHRLSANDGRHHLHGGFRGFDRVVWQEETSQAGGGPGLVLHYSSRDGEEGYPGRLNAGVTYTLTEQNELVIDYLATTDEATPINLTQHSSFNLAGAGSGDILGHLLQVNSESMTPIDETRIPTGEIVSVSGGPFDFRSLTAVGARIAADHEQLRRGNGYDHNFVVSRGGEGLVHGSGRILDVFTTEPGLQLYSGNFFDGAVIGKGGRPYDRHAGLSLETQHYPDSPNQPSFPSTIVRPGKEYRSRTVFAFGVTG